jgi:hypothetical protein
LIRPGQRRGHNGLSGELDPFDLTSEATLGVVELESVITD